MAFGREDEGKARAGGIVPARSGSAGYPSVGLHARIFYTARRPTAPGPALETCVDRPPLRVGVIADTHGLLRPAALAALRGCDHIIHAGDVGGPAILEALAELAPLSTVRGNNDREPWAEALPERLRLELGGVALYVLHDLKELEFAPADQGIAVVISGHSHAPRQERRDGVLYLNPGSAGPRRFRLPIALAHLVLGDGEPRVESIDLAG